jgi:hypothetical protein
MLKRVEDVSLYAGESYLKVLTGEFVVVINEGLALVNSPDEISLK